MHSYNKQYPSLFLCDVGAVLPQQYSTESECNINMMNKIFRRSVFVAAADTRSLGQYHQNPCAPGINIMASPAGPGALLQLIIRLRDGPLCFSMNDGAARGFFFSFFPPARLSPH